MSLLSDRSFGQSDFDSALLETMKPDAAVATAKKMLHQRHRECKIRSK